MTATLERRAATGIRALPWCAPWPAHPLMTQRVSGLIRVHGIWLWLRRLPVRPRPVPSLESVR